MYSIFRNKESRPVFKSCHFTPQITVGTSANIIIQRIIPDSQQYSIATYEPTVKAASKLCADTLPLGYFFQDMGDPILAR